MSKSSPWTPLHAKLHQTLRQRSLLPKQEKLLVAVSGGQDSLCLIKLLLDLQPKWGWQLAIAHCDHCWASDQGIATHVENIAQELELPFFLKVAHTSASDPTPLETEATARKWRYQALEEVARKNNFQRLVTGHTRTDLAETILYNLLRGSGTDGLQALRWERPLNESIQLVRPLLNVSRQETKDFCEQQQLVIWEDAANSQLRYARNRIRTELIPYLKTHFNPQVETRLAQTAEILREEVNYLESHAQKLLHQATTPTDWEQPEAHPRGINRFWLRDISVALQRRVMRQFLRKFLPVASSFEEIEALTNLIDAPNRSRSSSLPGGLVAEVRGEWIVLTQQNGEQQEAAN